FYRFAFKFMNKHYLFFLWFCFATPFLWGQCDNIVVQGKVLDTLMNPGFYNLMVINKSTGKASFGQPDGSFVVYAQENHQLVLSTKQYETITFLVQADANCQFNRVYILSPVARTTQEVVIKPLKSLEELKEERAKLAMKDSRLVYGVNAFQSPITALYQAFSKKEQQKQWINEQVFKDNQRKVVQELLRTYIAYDIISLTDREFDAFLTFLNLDINFLKTASELELITYIKDKYEHFKSYRVGDQ
ncbi:MAG: hypothetical protein ACKO4K_07350, partial [Flavobacteriales bacterium]